MSMIGLIDWVTWLKCDININIKGINVIMERGDSGVYGLFSLSLKNMISFSKRREERRNNGMIGNWFIEIWLELKWQQKVESIENIVCLWAQTLGVPREELVTGTASLLHNLQSKVDLGEHGCVLISEISSWYSGPTAYYSKLFGARAAVIFILWFNGKLTTPILPKVLKCTIYHPLY